MDAQAIKRMVREAQFTRAVDKLETEYQRPLIRDVEHIAENVYGARLAYAGWEALAKKFAAHLPGIVMPTSSGLVWICGGNGPHGWLIDNTPIDPERPEKGSRVDGILEARSCVMKTGYTGKVGWTQGGIGKSLLKYVTEPQDYSKNIEQLFDGIDQGYHICKPGYHPSGVKLWDCSGYYYSLFSRIADEPNRSLKVLINQKGADFYPWKDGERERFREVMEAVKECKSLRNAMIGAAQGSTESRVAYTSSMSVPGQARSFMMHGKPGPFRAVALLTVRTGYELAQKEALTSSAIYGMVDSVMLTGNAEPRVWPAYGLAVNLVSRGDADVIGRANYRVGNEAKHLYKRGVKLIEPEAGAVSLAHYYHKELLGS